MRQAHWQRAVQRVLPLPRPQLQAFLDFYDETVAEKPLYCSDPKCSTFINQDLIDEPAGVARCRKCPRRTCTGCGKRAHGDVCRSSGNWRDLFEGRQLQQCPKCQRLIERTAGCKVMSCRWGQRFCYICGEKLKSHACGCTTNPVWDRMH